ncbi:bis(5'-nucleosyl)-tetraphosphatase (symmetrical) YqeK [Exiguobacterium flavidum]|uniref:bis(5'-nucleosyl)-tetraphosphatase (symmetrical) YqeK n=1 Tax=Exiguobacterium flavidum TaxID=2184695 RepID=UPI000DF78924|nr:bis(5'-nucleosyl)-tetraphosphatase (symmetrical) YqeK [Exiguobacterium flavidum]
MQLEEARRIIEGTLPTKRYVHTLGVVETARHLAELYGEPIDQVVLAAMLHDYAKYRDSGEMKKIAIELGKRELLDYDDELLHAPIGAELVKRELHVADPVVLRAIANHTTGEPGMSRIDQIIFVADAIEPNRTYPGVEQLREVANKDLTHAVVRTLAHTIRYLIGKEERIFPLTIETYNDFIFQLRKGTVI